MKELPEDHWGWTYGALIKSMEVDQLHRVDIGDYQGDSLVLVKDGERYGFLTFGWGSCSGCDELEACADLEQVTAVRDGLYNSIHWEDSAASMLAYLEAKDTRLEWYGSYESDTKKFFDEAASILRQHVGQAGFGLAS